jgi:hypothetical protein
MSYQRSNAIQVIIYRAITLAAIIVAGAAGIGCKVKTEGFCCVTQSVCDENNGGGVITPCTEPGAPFCDELGTYPASHGIGRQCIPDPNETACSGPQDCTTAGYPFCIDQQCRACDGKGMGCTAAAPVCSSTYSCGACSDDDQCLAYAATGQPHCAASGACVACVDSSQCGSPMAPVCDDKTNACRGCEADSECTSQACDREGGACLPEANVIYLSPTGQTSGTCTRAAPCSTFALGLAQVNGTRNIIKAAPGTYSGQVNISGQNVVIYADGATIAPSSIGQDAIVIASSADVTIQGGTITMAAGAGAGVRCTNSTLTLHRTTVSANAGGGVSISGCSFSIVNNMIVENGGATSTFGGVKLDSVTGAIHDFKFNTVANNTGLSGANTGVTCSNLFVSMPLNSSIIYGNTVGGSGAQVGGDSHCSASYSDIGPQNLSGTGNVDADPQFIDPTNGNFHLQAGSPAKDGGDPAATVNVDIDLDHRPQGAGFDMGADEIVE